MPIYRYKCTKCNLDSEEFVWNGDAHISCPECGTEMIRLFTTSNMPLLNREKPISFKYDPHEPNADKNIWKTVISDAEKGKLHPGELKFWKREMAKSNPNVIV
jgi:putative FmdB family regulatory protein